MWIQKVPGGGVEGVTFSPDGRTLYTSDRSGWITAWDTATHAGRKFFRLTPEVERCNHIHLRMLGARRLLTNALHWIVWDAEKGTEDSRVPVEFARWVLKQDRARLYSRAATGDAVLTWDFDARGPGPTIEGWNLLGGLSSFDITRDRKTAVLTDGDGYVTLFDVQARQELYRFEPVFSSSGLWGACFSPGGDALLLKAGHRLRVWDVTTRTDRFEIVLSDWCPWLLEFHPTAPLFAGLNPKLELTFFNLTDGRPTRSLDFRLGRFIQCAEFSPDGLTCAIGGSNKQFAVFDVDA